jgi:hypothetical protein
VEIRIDQKKIPARDARVKELDLALGGNVAVFISGVRHASQRKLPMKIKFISYTRGSRPGCQIISHQKQEVEDQHEHCQSHVAFPGRKPFPGKASSYFTTASLGCLPQILEAESPNGLDNIFSFRTHLFLGE